MRLLRISTVALIGLFSVLSIAQSQTEQIYSSQHKGWGLMLGNCQLKVKTLSSGAVFTPVGNSALQFEGAIPDEAHASVPAELKQVAVRSENQVLEKLKIYFVVQGSKVLPDKYIFSREYSRKDKTGSNGVASTVEKYEVNCLDLKPDTI